MIWDVVVVGAGPAGGECARQLASSGYATLLIERAPSFTANPFSTAGAPLSILDQFHLPTELVGSYWHTLRFLSDEREQAWHSPTPGGVVLDFARLRSFLAQEVERAGGELRLATAYKSHRITSTGVELTTSHGPIEARLVVDATGSERRLLAHPSKGIEATGLELLVEVDELSYGRWGDALNFFMGKVVPRGYGWIFPMELGRLKVGIGRYYPHEQRASYTGQLKQLLERATEGRGWREVERHGKTLRYTLGRKDPHLQGPILAIGDAISTANPLAFEGIRHAMKSGQIAASCIDRHFRGERGALHKFAPQMRRYCGLSWRATEWLTQKIYRCDRSDQIDALLDKLAPLTYQELYDLCFHYRWRPIIRFLISILK